MLRRVAARRCSTASGSRRVLVCGSKAARLRLCDASVDETESMSTVSLAVAKNKAKAARLAVCNTLANLRPRIRPGLARFFCYICVEAWRKIRPGVAFLLVCRACVEAWKPIYRCGGQHFDRRKGRVLALGARHHRRVAIRKIRPGLARFFCSYAGHVWKHGNLSTDAGAGFRPAERSRFGARRSAP